MNALHEDKHKPHPPQPLFRITINGTAEVWDRKKITYIEVVQLAFPGGLSGGDVRYSVSWTKLDGREGSLRPGQSVKVEEGMIFHVRNTDKS